MFSGSWDFRESPDPTALDPDQLNLKLEPKQTVGAVVLFENHSSMTQIINQDNYIVTINN